MADEFRRQTSDMLVNRIDINARSQSLDFDGWVFSGLDFQQDARVLEICCGTGKQTKIFLDRLGSEAKITAVDISQESLDRLKNSLAVPDDARLRLINCDMDALVEDVLDQERDKYDLIFCSYGLYYSRNVQKLLAGLRRFIRNSGQMVVIGPYGPNNDQLFKLVERTGATIDPEIKFTSAQFMYRVVFPWMTLNFSSVSARTTYNDIAFDNINDILTYCRSTTYYRDDLRDDFVEFAKAEMDKNGGKFINTKWIMSLVATGVRANADASLGAVEFV